MTPRQQHGHYDADAGLPDNTMQPVGSGTNTWLQQQVLELLGSEAGQALIDEARSHGTKRYTWLCDCMAERGHDDLAQSYKARKKADEAARRLRDKHRYLKSYKAELDNPETNEARRSLVFREMAKLQKYIDERTQG